MLGCLKYDEYIDSLSCREWKWKYLYVDGENADHGFLDEDEFFLVLRVAVNQLDTAILVHLEQKPAYQHTQIESRGGQITPSAYFEEWHHLDIVLDTKTMWEYDITTTAVVVAAAASPCYRR